MIKRKDGETVKRLGDGCYDVEERTEASIRDYATKKQRSVRGQIVHDGRACYVERASLHARPNDGADFNYATASRVRLIE